MYMSKLFESSNFEQFLRQNRNLSEYTIYLYINVIEKFLYDNNDLEDIESYNKFIIKNGVQSHNSIYYSTLKTFIKHKITDKGKRATMIENLIKPNFEKPPQRERKYLSEDQIIQIINNMREQKHKVVALIQDLTGVRAGDVLRIPRGNIIPEIYDNQNVLKIITIGKKGKRNVVYIHDEISQDLIIDFLAKNYICPDYYFLENKRRKKLRRFDEYQNYKSNYLAYYRDLKQAMAAIGLNMKDFATHDYRRCYARRAWTKYKDINVLKNLLNHENVNTTLRYLQQSGLKNVDYHKEMQMNI